MGENTDKVNRLKAEEQIGNDWDAYLRRKRKEREEQDWTFEVWQQYIHALASSGDGDWTEKYEVRMQQGRIKNGKRVCVQCGVQNGSWALVKHTGNKGKGTKYVCHDQFMCHIRCEYAELKREAMDKEMRVRSIHNEMASLISVMRQVESIPQR